MNRHYCQSFTNSGASSILSVGRSYLFFFSLVVCLTFSGGAYLLGHTSPPQNAKRDSESDVTRFNNLDTNQDQRLSQQEFLKTAEKKSVPD